MSRILGFATTALLCLPGLVSAQQDYLYRTTPTGDAGTLVRSGYDRYLHRDPGASGATWVQALRNGQTREDLMAGLLSSDEYLAKAGGTKAGFVQHLYRDVIGRDPLPAEINYWVGRLQYETPKEIAYVMVRRYPQAESVLKAPAPTTYDPGYFPDPASPTFRDPGGPYFHSPYFYNYERSRSISAFPLSDQG